MLWQLCIEMVGESESSFELTGERPGHGRGLAFSQRFLWASCLLLICEAATHKIPFQAVHLWMHLTFHLLGLEVLHKVRGMVQFRRSRRMWSRPLIGSFSMSLSFWHILAIPYDVPMLLE